MRAHAYGFLHLRKYEDQAWYWTIHVKISNREKAGSTVCTAGSALINRVYSPVIELINYHSLRANIGCQNINNQYFHRRRRSQNEIQKKKAKNINLSPLVHITLIRGRFLALVLPVKAVEGIKGKHLTTQLEFKRRLNTVDRFLLFSYINRYTAKSVYLIIVYCQYFINSRRWWRDCAALPPPPPYSRSIFDILIINNRLRTECGWMFYCDAMSSALSRFDRF